MNTPFQYNTKISEIDKYFSLNIVNILLVIICILLLILSNRNSAVVFELNKWY